MKGICAFDEIVEPAPELHRTKVVNARGWPLLSFWMEGSGYSHRTDLDAGKEIEYRGGMVWTRQSTYDIMAVEDSEKLLVPFRPIWHGLVIDAGFYAVAFFVLWRVRGWLRQRVKILSRRSISWLVLGCLLGGFLTAIGVVAICVAYLDVRHAATIDLGESCWGPDHVTWYLYCEQINGATKLMSAWYRHAVGGSGGAPNGSVDDFLPFWVAAYLTPTDSDHVRRFADARGWPMLAMWGGFEEPQSIRGGRFVGRLGDTHRAVVLQRYHDGEFRADMSRVIPLAPIWSGLAGNTLFYAVIWMVLTILFVGPGIIRRSIRHWRGHCIHCGYDLRLNSSDRCPECGGERIGYAVAGITTRPRLSRNVLRPRRNTATHRSR